MAKKPKKITHEELIRLYLDSGEGQFRNENIYIYEGSVTDRGDDIFFHREELEMLDKNGQPHKISWTGIKTCSFGHIVSADQNRVIGKCSCGAFLCAARGCAYSCRRCGRVCCRRCIVIYENDTPEFFCKKHSYLYFLHRITKYLFGFP